MQTVYTGEFACTHRERDFYAVESAKPFTDGCITGHMTAYSTFEHLRSENIASLGLDIEEYRHRKTGAIHYHLASDNPENVFLVALRTVPDDSTGVAHILEHTALCGSEKYPVRDPFFMMIRRSLNTFMNAFTSSDWTAYPFASQNRKDFDNLLQVYLDAVFFSRLDPLDFAQEGHRLEFATPDDPDSELQFKGVVFNEMKGAMSSVPSQLWQSLCKYLFPTTTYHHNSGGDPECIPDLSYEQLCAFYRSHYHPSNAIFMTFGDIPAADHQQKFETLALSRFEALDEQIAVPDEKRYHAPLRVQEYYPLTDSESLDNKTHVVMGWLLGKTTDLQALLEAQLLSSVLMDNSASPLLQVLETTKLGSAPSPLCGLEDSLRELVFACGLEGSEAGSSAEVEQLILDTLQQVATDGVPQEQVEAVLHQLELHQREIGGDSYPYGLQLILSALGSATHRGDAIAVLNLDPVIEQLRENIRDPEYIKGLARRLLLDNPHRVTLVMAPDAQMADRRDAAEAARLAAIKAALSDADKSRIVTQAAALAERQQLQEDESILPKVGRDDVPAEIPEIPSHRAAEAALATTCYGRGTNGLVYQQLLLQLPQLPSEAMALMPFYSNMLTELGVGERDYLATQAWQASVCGSISAYSTLRATVDDEQDTRGYLVLSSKALLRNHQQQSELMRATLESVRFDEHQRIAELIAQQRARRESAVTNSGHMLAMNAACSGMNPAAQLSHQLSGLGGILAVKALDKSLQEQAQRQHVAEQLGALHQQLLAGDSQLLMIAEDEQLAELERSAAELWKGFAPGAGAAALALEPVRTTARQLWVANTQVNFCAKAYPTVAGAHPDAPALAVLGGFLRNGYLHRAIREQGGAYGGGASQDSTIAAFRFYSYRDPRLAETLDDFDRALDWLQSAQHSEESLEQAILGVIGSLDKPGSPAGDAKQDFHNALFGRDRAHRQLFRQRVLAVTIADLQRVAQTYLQPEQASVAVITNQQGLERHGALAERLELERFSL